jgi:hypothetical protein
LRPQDPKKEGKKERERKRKRGREAPLYGTLLEGWSSWSKGQDTGTEIIKSFFFKKLRLLEEPPSEA